MTTTVDARDLAERAHDGDVDAFGQLYATYHGQVYHYLLRRTLNQPLAEDLAQDVFVRALRYIDRWQWQGKDPRAWLFTIARNLVVDHYRSSRFRLEVTVAGHDDAPDDDRHGDPEDQALVGAHVEALAEVLLQLTDDQRACLTLRFTRGLSVIETAEVMGRDASAVKSLQHRAVRTLSRLLGREW